MALDDIKKSILDDARKEAERLRAEGEKEVHNIKKRWNEKVDQRVKDIVSQAHDKAEQKIQQTRFKIQASNQAEILKKKQKIIDSVYDQVLNRLKNLSDKDYVALVQKLISNLPDVGGEIISVRGKTKLLEEALIAAGREYYISEDNVSGSGGFIFKSEKIDIDSTFEALIESSKQETEVKVAEILFSNKD